MGGAGIIMPVGCIPPTGAGCIGAAPTMGIVLSGPKGVCCTPTCDCTCICGMLYAAF